MKQATLTLLTNKALTPDVYEMRLAGADRPVPGSFLEIGLDGFFLKRPFGAAGYKDGVLTVYYRVVGAGTEAMTRLSSGEKLEALTMLGTGFNYKGSTRPLIVSGGLGIAPLKYLADCFHEAGVRPVFVAGFKCRSDVILNGELEKICDLFVTTDDGSLGYHGNAVEFLKQNPVAFDRYFACGPEPMLRGMQRFSVNGQLSLEARMGCGFGACMGCSITTVSGFKRVCKEGPVFDAGEVIFDAR